MECSMDAYLRRRTDAELVMALEICLSQNEEGIHNETIKLILNIQNERKQLPSSPDPS